LRKILRELVHEGLMFEAEACGVDLDPSAVYTSRCAEFFD